MNWGPGVWVDPSFFINLSAGDGTGAREGERVRVQRSPPGGLKCRSSPPPSSFCSPAPGIIYLPVVLNSCTPETLKGGFLAGAVPSDSQKEKFLGWDSEFAASLPFPASAFAFSPRPPSTLRGVTL